MPRVRLGLAPDPAGRPGFWDTNRVGLSDRYPLVMTNIAMENHYFIWEKQL